MLSSTKSRTAGKILIQTLFFFFTITQICFAQWVQVGLNDVSIKDIAVQNSIIFAVTSDSCVYRSLDGGTNWTMIVDSKAVDVAISPTGKVFMIKDSSWSSWSQWDSLYTSTDNGDSWLLSDAVVQLVDSFGYYCGAGCIFPKRIIVSPEGNIILSILYGAGGFGTVSTGFAISNDDGLTWPTPGPSIVGGHIADFRDNFIITSGSKGGSTSSSDYIYLSSDYGNTWNFLGDPPRQVPNIIGLFSNGNIISGGPDLPYFSHPIFISTDFCNTWSELTSFVCQVGLSWSSGSEEGMLIGTKELGVFLFSDEGDSLGSWNEGLTDLNVQALTLDNNGYVYAGTENGVWRRPLSEVTSVEENQIEIPSSYNLSQNFPNPFNPSTKISWQLPVGSQQTLKVFDVLGNEIATLVDEYKPAGRYEVEFNAANLPSGVYFYQLRAGEFTAVKKMLLLK